MRGGGRGRKGGVLCRDTVADVGKGPLILGKKGRKDRREKSL